MKNVILFGIIVLWSTIAHAGLTGIDNTLVGHGIISAEPYVIVASATASASVKVGANYVCDGVNDQIEINAAIQAATSVNDYAGTGVDKTCAYIQLSAGVFNISDSIIVDRAIRLSGVSGGQTVILLDDSSNCHMIVLEKIQFTAGDVATNTTPLGIIEHMMIDGNEDNQDDAENIYVTSATGTDADPSVITKSTEFAANDALVGRRAWVRGTNVENSEYGNLYTITASTADTITLDRNISSGGALSGLSVDIEGWCGVYQIVHDYDDTYANGQIDFRFTDIWFDDVAGACISLGHFWNHKIHQCTFEHCPGPAIEIRGQTGTVDATPTNMHIYANFLTDMGSFIRCLGPEQCKYINVFDNRISNLTGNRVVDIPGSNFNFHDNLVSTHSSFAADGILIYWDNTPSGKTGILHGCNIHHNQFVDGADYDTILRVISPAGATYGYNCLNFDFNTCYDSSSTNSTGPTDDAVKISGVGSKKNNLSICHNTIRQHSSATGDLITVVNAVRFTICDNMLRAATGKNEIVTAAGMTIGIIQGNCVGQGIDSTAIGADTVVADNPGDT